MKFSIRMVELLLMLMSNWTSGSLTGGQEYLLAIAHWQYGGGARIRPWVEIPGGSFVVMNPLSPAQDGYV